MPESGGRRSGWGPPVPFGGGQQGEFYNPCGSHRPGTGGFRPVRLGFEFWVCFGLAPGSCRSDLSCDIGGGSTRLIKGGARKSWPPSASPGSSPTLKPIFPLKVIRQQLPVRHLQAGGGSGRGCGEIFGRGKWEEPLGGGGGWYGNNLAAIYLGLGKYSKNWSKHGTSL